MTKFLALLVIGIMISLVFELVSTVLGDNRQDDADIENLFNEDQHGGGAE